MQNGEFRDDLFFRLAVGRVELPPLRRRQGDIRLLAKHFWRALGNPEEPISADTLARFEQYDWPGNVRELLNTVARHCALGDLAAFQAPVYRADAQQDTEFVRAVLETDLPLSEAKQEIIHRFEPLYLTRVLAKNDGDVGRAAEASGVARRYFNVLRARHRK